MSEAKVRYALKRTVAMSFDAADEKVREALQQEGFGVLTEIDVKATLKKKLDVDFRDYKILGACNPPLAHQALRTEIDVGLLLPCNVVVRATDDPDQVVIEALDPVIQLDMAESSELPNLAQEVRQRIERVLDSVAGA
jgi:uncharacterized protein (DUF302 family)